MASSQHVRSGSESAETSRLEKPICCFMYSLSLGDQLGRERGQHKGRDDLQQGLTGEKCPVKKRRRKKAPSSRRQRCSCGDWLPQTPASSWTTTQDKLQSLQGLVQNEIAGPLVQKFQRRWQVCAKTALPLSSSRP